MGAKMLQLDQSDAHILSMILDSHTRDEGFRLLMTSYQERVYWHIRRMVHIHEDADDVTQNTFIKVYRNIERFEGKSSLYTWIYRIATNESITHINKRKKRKESAIDNEDSNFINHLKADPFFDGDEAQTKLVAAIQTLPAKQKEVFNLRYYDEMSYRDMSSFLETSEGALKASYHHALKKIESHLKNNVE